MVFEKVKKIIVEELNVAEEKVTMEASLVEDLEADSLDAVEIIVRIEEEFDLQVDDEAAENVKTVGDLVKCIEANLK
ncbi:MAG: acyl carrier protein [Bacilli bacterium]|jgi:acyl carrier protein|nr:acyl carrier protein [Bacilli bacterium]